MIHTYLIQVDQEDADEDGYEYEDGNHGPNFVIKMSDINKMANLNITVSRTLKFIRFFLTWQNCNICFLFQYSNRSHMTMRRVAVRKK